MFLGYLGTALLLCSYIFLYFNKHLTFYILDAVASVILTLHAIIIGDIPFILVNGFISILLIGKSIKAYKNGKTN